MIWQFVDYLILKFMFSKKATKIDNIFTVNLIHLLSKRQIDGNILSIFMAFLENINFI